MQKDDSLSSGRVRYASNSHFQQWAIKSKFCWESDVTPCKSPVGCFSWGTKQERKDMYSIHRIYFSKSSRSLPKDILKLKSLIRNQCPLKPNAGYKLHKSRSATNLNNIFSSISMAQLFLKTLKSPLYILLHLYTTQIVSKQLYNDEQEKKNPSITQIPSNMRLIQILLYRRSCSFSATVCTFIGQKKVKENKCALFNCPFFWI